MASRLKLRCCLLNAVNIKLKPSLRDRDLAGPGVCAETRLRRLREWPQSKTLYSIQSFGVKIAVFFLFEGNVEGIW